MKNLERFKENNSSLDDVEGVGVGVPGPVGDDGTIYKCVNLGWGVFNAQEELSGLLNGVKVKVGNDANVAALGEMYKGGGVGYNNIVMVTLGTGVGGGVIIDGKIIFISMYEFGRDFQRYHSGKRIGKYICQYN